LVLVALHQQDLQTKVLMEAIQYSAPSHQLAAAAVVLNKLLVFLVDLAVAVAQTITFPVVPGVVAAALEQLEATAALGALQQETVEVLETLQIHLHHKEMMAD